MRLAELDGGLATLVGAADDGTDFTQSSAARALANLVRAAGLRAAARVVADPRTLPALARVVAGGSDKGRGNAAQALGALCDLAAARGVRERGLARAHQGRAGATTGLLPAVLRAATDCEGVDARVQALGGLARLVAVHRGNAEAVAGAAPDALDSIVAIAVDPDEGRVAPAACRVLAELGDVAGASPLVGLRLAHTAQALERLAAVAVRGAPDPAAAATTRGGGGGGYGDGGAVEAGAEACRAFANLTAAAAGDADFDAAEAALRARGVPELRAVVADAPGVMPALVRAAWGGSDAAREQAARCLRHLAEAGYEFGDRLAARPGVLPALVGLCRGGSDSAKLHVRCSPPPPGGAGPGDPKWIIPPSARASACAYRTAGAALPGRIRDARALSLESRTDAP
jgi:hypothetical protein